MKKERNKLTKRRIAAIISSVIIVLVFVAVFVVNLFIPVKYLTAYLSPRAQREPGVLTVSFINVDYGDCIVIELPDGKVMMIDGGDGSYPHMLEIIGHLNSRGIETIDYLVCSSVQSEHCGGLPEIFKYKKVNNVYMPYVKNSYITDAYHAFTRAVNEAGVHTEFSCFGVGVAEEEADYFFTFLSPGYYTNENGEYAALNETASLENIRDASAVLWLEYGETSFVFTSDAGKNTLKKMTDDYAFSLIADQPYCRIGNRSVDLSSCDVATVAAHGYEDCTCAEWYDCLDPDLAVLSVGKNYAGCPSLQSLADVSNKANLIRTDYQGTVSIRVTKSGYVVI